MLKAEDTVLATVSDSRRVPTGIGKPSVFLSSTNPVVTLQADSFGILRVANLTLWRYVMKTKIVVILTLVLNRRATKGIIKASHYSEKLHPVGDNVLPGGRNQRVFVMYLNFFTMESVV